MILLHGRTERSLFLSWEKTDQAMDNILTSEKLDPTNNETWYQKARILSYINQDRDRALDSLLVAISIAPENRDRALKDQSFENIKNDMRFKRMFLTS